MQKKDFYGAHLSVAGGVASVFERATLVGAHAVQIFTKSNRSYFAKPLLAEEIRAFREARAASSVAVVVTHAAYLINLAAADDGVEKKSVQSLKHEVERCAQLEIPYLVLHPGAYTTGTLETGIEKIARNLSAVLASAPGDVMVLLETAAGQGTTIGRTFEELRAIYDACDAKVRKRIGVCLDTCHVWAAGYSLASKEEYHAMIKNFDKKIGLDILKIAHLNDSATVCGSETDRHANLHKGHIPAQVLKLCAQEMSNTGIAVILETPSIDGISEYKEEIKFLRL